MQLNSGEDQRGELNGIRNCLFLVFCVFDSLLQEEHIYGLTTVSGKLLSFTFHCCVIIEESNSEVPFGLDSHLPIEGARTISVHLPKNKCAFPVKHFLCSCFRSSGKLVSIY